MEIGYVKGDATSPVAEGNKIIVHVCNDIGGWGKGFVNAISAKWKEPEKRYRDWHQSGENFILGQVQLVKVEDEIWVANVIGQRNIRADKNGHPPVRYEAVEEALIKVSQYADELKASVHMPRIGCGLAGGTWDKMEAVVKRSLTDKEIAVTVYDFG